MKELPDKPNLRPGEVAKFFDVCTKTIRRWTKKGLLRRSSPPGCDLRITRESVLKYYQSREEEEA